MENNKLTTARILIVDDQPSNVALLRGILEEEDFASCRGITDSREALPVFIEYLPDLILLDLQMPFLDGFEVMKQLQACLSPGDFLPILVLTADITPEAKRRALTEGALDFLTKPFDATEVVLRIKNLLQTRSLHLQLRGQNQFLDQKVRDRTAELEATQIEILERMALAAEYRDDDTGEHTKRVGRTSARIAEALGWSVSEVELLRRAAPLHDVGKIAISDSILLKPAKLTTEEFETMKRHTTLGAKMLSGGRFPLLQLAEQIALTHHERWDGTGYIGMRGEDIPMAGRIVTVADVFDALTSARPYKEAWPLSDAIAEIQRQSGRQFDPQIVEAFLKVVRQEFTVWL
ncbi:MAG TPA: HD domain-containing phosphohydrolase [Pyrinomonadaceae bacterium]|nr:HD domain-containing phosphohydrolase [Pyrinomonadaceae bacterium]HLO32878.1 HD domain-containing phosphohydrolase [Anaerolineales bacterium]